MHLMRYRFILLLILTAIIAAVPLAVASQAQGSPAAQSDSVNFTLEPASANLTVGDEFDLAVTFDATDQPVTVAQAYLDFEPEFLQVVDVTPGDVFTPDGSWPLEDLENSFDNSTGRIDFAGGRGVDTGEDASGRVFQLAIIRLEAVAPTNGAETEVTFSTADPRQTLAVSGVDQDGDVEDVTGALTGATLAIDPDEVLIDVTFTMSLQGRGNSVNQWQMPFEVRLCDPLQTPILVQSFTATTESTSGSNSSFVVENVLPGIYHVWAKGENTLAVLRPNQALLTDGSTVDLGMQTGGDATGDNAVNSADYSDVVDRFGTVPSSAAARLHDHNRDGVIDAIDYAIVVENFKESGDSDPCAAVLAD